MEKLKKITRKLKKMFKKRLTQLTTAYIAMLIMTTPAHASAGALDPTEFLTKAQNISQIVIGGTGAVLAVVGIINFLEGQSDHNAAAKNQGGKQIIGGVGIVLVAMVLVPVVFNMIKY